MTEFPDLMTVQETADALRISVRSLERLNGEKRGPPRVTLTARRVAYSRAGVRAWLDARTTPATQAA